MTDGIEAGPDEAAVRDALRGVVDPELWANIVDLGLVRAIRIEARTVTIDLVLTAPGCPLAGWIVQRVRIAVGEVPGVEQVDVRLLDEPWSPNLVDWESWVR